MTVFGVACARFCTLTLQQFTPARSPHSRSLSAVWGFGAPFAPSSLPSKLGRFIGHAPQQTQQCGRRILGVSHCWCRTTVSGSRPFGSSRVVRCFEPPSWHAVLQGARPVFQMSSSQVLGGQDGNTRPHPEWNATTENTR